MIVSLLQWENPYVPAVEAEIGEKVTVCRTGEEAALVLPEADIIITLGTGRPLFNSDLLAVSGKLKLVLSVSAGIERLPLRELNARGIAVCNTGGAQAISIAEYVLGAMLSVSHSIPAFIRNQEKACWKNIFGSDLEGRTLCIVGAGRIGAEIARRAKAFNMKIIGLKRHPEQLMNYDFVWGVEHLHKALGQSDIVVMATPLTKDTFHLMKAEEFGVMKKTAVFINISRGGTVDETAMISALKTKQIAGAVLDVFETEPLPEGSVLWQMENVLLTPHNASFTDTTDRCITSILCDNIIRFREGRVLINQILKDDLRNTTIYGLIAEEAHNDSVGNTRSSGKSG